MKYKRILRIGAGATLVSAFLDFALWVVIRYCVPAWTLAAIGTGAALLMLILADEIDE